MFSQIAKLWNDLGLKQRATIAVSFGLVVIGMSVLLAWAGRPDMRMLYSGMDTDDMADMVAALEEKGVAYKTGEDGRSLYVAADSVHTARLDLASRGLPKGGSIGYEIFDRTNFGISSFAQHTNFIRALQGELARTITQLQAVRSARVLVVIPENRMLMEGEMVRTTASVFIDARGGLSNDNVRAVQHLVAHAVEGLDPRDVALVNQAGRLLSDTGEDGDPLSSPGGALQYRADLEGYYSRKVETLLASVVGPENIVARVSVDVDLDSETRRQSVYDPESQVVREETKAENTTVSTESRSSPPVGAESNVGEDSQASPSSDNTTREEQKETTVSYEINETQVERVVRPGGIRQVSAAVFIALRYNEGEAGERVPQPRTEAELNKLAEMVRQTLGTTRDGRPAEVTVEELPFSQPLDLMGQPLLKLPTDPLFWIGQVRTVAALLVALVMFLLLLRMLKRQHQHLAGVEIIEPEQTEEARRARLQAQLTPEFLNALIEEKPENVSTALKNWVTNAEKTEG